MRFEKIYLFDFLASEISACYVEIGRSWYCRNRAGLCGIFRFRNGPSRVEFISFIPGCTGLIKCLYGPGQIRSELLDFIMGWAWTSKFRPISHFGYFFARWSKYFVAIWHNAIGSENPVKIRPIILKKRCVFALPRSIFTGRDSRKF